MSGSHIDHVCLGRMDVDTIHLHDGDGVVFNPDVLTRKSANVCDAEQISPVGHHGHGQVLGVVHEGGFGDWLGSRGVVLAHEARLQQ